MSVSAAVAGTALLLLVGTLHLQAEAVRERDCGLWLNRNGSSWYTSYATQPAADLVGIGLVTAEQETSLTYRDLSGIVRHFEREDCAFPPP